MGGMALKASWFPFQKPLGIDPAIAWPAACPVGTETPCDAAHAACSAPLMALRREECGFEASAEENLRVMRPFPAPADKYVNRPMPSDIALNKT